MGFQGVGRLLLIVIFVSFWLGVLASIRTNADSKWRETKWSECIPRGNCVKPGYRTKQIHCVDSNDVVVDDKRCKGMTLNKPRILYSSCVPNSCLWKLKALLKTRLSDWGECSAVPLNTWNSIKHKLQDSNGTREFPNCEKDAVGVAFVRRRELLCKIKYPPTSDGEGKLSVDVEPSSCGKTFQLDLTKWKFCFFACVNTCALSQWSSWVACDHCRQPRTRYRIRTHMSLLLPNMDKFMNYCPHMAKIKSRKQPAPSESGFHQFKVFPWDKGRKMRDRKKNGEVLLQTTLKHRNIECVNRIGDTCNKTSLNIPPKTIMVDDYDCLMTTWTNWGSCHSPKGLALATRGAPIATGPSIGVEERRRSIKTLPVGKGKACGEVREQRSCNVSSREVSGNEYRYAEGQWSQCAPFKGPSTLYNIVGCQVTFKWRSVFCYHHNNDRREPHNRTPVPDHFCQKRIKPQAESLCEVSCPEKCIYENWSTWSHCTQKNIMRRFKSSIINDNKCPRISQKRYCNFHWVKTLNQACVPLMTSKCGFGYHNHTIHCFKSGKNIVDQNLCDPSTKPTQYTQCDIPCLNSTSAQQQMYPYHLIKDFLSKSEDGEGTSLFPPKTQKGDFFWYPSAWGECTLVRGGRASYTRHCTLGQKVRHIHCVNGTPTNIVEEHFCNDTIKLTNESRCTLCQQGCIISQWSLWEPPCSAMCNPLIGANPPTTTRKRYIVVHGNRYGMECGNQKLIETKQCAPCPQFHWVAGEWDPCHLRYSVEVKFALRDTVPGIQIRRVYCSDGTKEVNDGICINLRQPKPAPFRDCFLNWMRCSLLPWTEWSECSKKCSKGVQKRSRRFASDTPICYKNKEHKYTESRACNIQPCRVYKTSIGPWGSCHRLTGQGQGKCPPYAPFTTLGVQNRNVSCHNVNGVMVADQFCHLEEKATTRVRNCMVPCVRDCRLSEWSDFTPCSTTCGSGMKSRMRSILQVGTNGGKMCPPVVDNSQYVVQKMPCKLTECFVYAWSRGEWGECVVKNNNASNRSGSNSRNNNSKGYNIINSSSSSNNGNSDEYNNNKSSNNHSNNPNGNKSNNNSNNNINNNSLSANATNNPTISISDHGLRKRKVWCKDIRTGNHSDLCDIRSKPEEESFCEASSVRACAVTQWSTWSTCCTRHERTNNLVVVGERTRQRYVLKVSLGQHHKCPVLKESQPCPKCEHYSFKATPWSSCFLEKEDDRCGVGIQRRFVDCQRSDGVLVPHAYCSNLGTMRTYQECRIGCSDGCLLSEWSTWTSCLNKCDSVGYRTRERFIRRKRLVKDECKGVLLKETLMCRVYPCYTLSFGTWEEKCTPVHQTNCGEGVRKRTAVCIRSDGNEVDLSYCYDYITGREHLQRRCYVPCWNDCIITPWSSWSSCFGICNENFTSLLEYGHRVQSRVVVQKSVGSGQPCPKDTYRMERCEKPECHSFHTIITDRITGTTQCKRSDGELLSYGCTPHKLPRFRCKCPLANAKCFQGKYCQCDSGFYPLVNKNNNVVRCASLTKHVRKQEVDALNLPMILLVVFIVFIGYCVMFIGIILLYKRHKNKSLRRVQDLINPEFNALQPDIRTSDTPNDCPPEIDSTMEMEGLNSTVVNNNPASEESVCGDDTRNSTGRDLQETYI